MQRLNEDRIELFEVKISLSSYGCDMRLPEYRSGHVEAVKLRGELCEQERWISVGDCKVKAAMGCRPPMHAPMWCVWDRNSSSVESALCSTCMGPETDTTANREPGTMAPTAKVGAIITSAPWWHVRVKERPSAMTLALASRRSGVEMG